MIKDYTNKEAIKRMQRRNKIEEFKGSYVAAGIAAVVAGTIIFSGASYLIGRPTANQINKMDSKVERILITERDNLSSQIPVNAYNLQVVADRTAKAYSKLGQRR